LKDSASEGLRFECTECGACCTRRGDYVHVYLSDDEADALADFLGLDAAAFSERHTVVDEFGWTRIRFDGEQCPFLDGATNRCRVYPARPTQCSTFPFWRGFVKDGAWTKEVREICEGIGQGPVHPADLVESNMKAMEVWDRFESEPDD
jgi:Fe-S-cluster containining protein